MGVEAIIENALVNLAYQHRYTAESKEEKNRLDGYARNVIYNWVIDEEAREMLYKKYEGFKR